MDNLLLIDKPVGVTSFDVIRHLRRAYTAAGLPIPKMGHAGTLDPCASGLMVLGLGSGTKRLAELTKLDKEYVAEILIGQSTTTGDREGTVVKEKAVAALFSDEVITTTLATMHGDLTLPVSGFSAIKIDGVPMYKRARAAVAAGKSVPVVSERAMYVYETELIATVPQTKDTRQFQLMTVRFRVGSGTYIRSLGEELGRRLGEYPAHLTSLRRTMVGDFALKDALPLADFRPQ